MSNMALRRIVPMMSLWLVFSACFHGCDWSDTTEPVSTFIEIQMPPDAFEAVITLGASPAQTVKIGDEDVDFRMIPVEEDLDKTNTLLVQFKDSNGSILYEEPHEVYVSKSGQTDINLQFVRITEPHIVTSLAEGGIGTYLTVRGWNFKPNEEVGLYLVAEDSSARTSVITNAGEDGSFEATIPVLPDLISDLSGGKLSVRAEGNSGSRADSKVMAKPGITFISLPVRLTVEAFPGGGGYGDPSYFDARLDGVGAVVLGIDGTFDAFCVDTDHSMVAEKTYTIITVYSSHLNLPEGLVEFPENLDLVNYILNEAYIGKSSPGGYGTYTYGDVQRAIWELLEDQQLDAGLGEWSQERVDEIRKDAESKGEGFIPNPKEGDKHTLILVPADEDGTIRQIFLILREASSD